MISHFHISSQHQVSSFYMSAKTQRWFPSSQKLQLLHLELQLVVARAPPLVPTSRHHVAAGRSAFATCLKEMVSMETLKNYMGKAVLCRYLHLSDTRPDLSIYTNLEDFDTLTVIPIHKAQGEYQGTIAQSTPPYPQRRRARHAATSSPQSLLQNPSPLPKRERPDHWKATRLDWERVQTYSWYAAQNSLMKSYKLGPRNSQGFMGFRTWHCVKFCWGNVGGVPGHIMTLKSTYATMCKFS